MSHRLRAAVAEGSDAAAAVMVVLLLLASGAPSRTPDKPSAQFVIQFKSTLISPILGLPAAPAGQTDLPAGGVRSAPQAGRPSRFAGAAGTPTFDESRVYFKMIYKLNTYG